MDIKKINRSLIFSVASILLVQVLFSQTSNRSPLSERITGYDIDVILDPVSKKVTGNMKAFWVNKSTDVVPDIQMHLYMNAFRDGNSTFHRELGFSPGKNPDDNGWIDIISFTGRNSSDLKPLIEYISPDDGNPDDKTVMRVLLPEPAYPGDTLFINMRFETKLPSFTGISGGYKRSGFNNDFFFVAQWFPKFGVYEPAGMRYAVKGGWNCHQFHAVSEFYSNHSVYNVTITLPEEFIVGSGGLLLSETASGTGSKTMVYRAEDIVDFAWTAWPGYAVHTDRWNHVNITLLIPVEASGNSTRQLVAVKNALEYFSENVGPYPWTHLTFIDPPGEGRSAGGMEYTTLFTSSSSSLMPSFLHIPELTTIHEMGHAWFMGIIASNEFEEPWLDEGINTFFEGLIADKYYGRESGFMNHRLLRISNQDYLRTLYTGSAHRQLASNAGYSWNYPHGTYYMLSYFKAATSMQTLMGIIGEETFNEIFREYYRKWAFRHPSGRDFINVVNDVVRRNHDTAFGEDMNWFFDQTLFGTGICDYKVTGFSNRRYEKNESRIAFDSIREEGQVDIDQIYNSKAFVERAGEIMLPVEVLIHFDNGDELIEKWDGKSRFMEFEYTGKRKIDWVKIDPGYKITMDVNHINNSMTDDPDRVPLRRFINKFIFFIQLYLSAAFL